MKYYRQLKEDTKNIRISIILLFLYSVVLILFNGANIICVKAIVRQIVIPHITFIATACIIRYNRRDVVQDLIKISVVASVISILLYALPTIAQQVRCILGVAEQLNEDTRIRGYGFAGSLFSGYSIIQSLCAYLCLLYDYSKLKYIKFFLILISVSLNARTGLFVLSGLILIHYVFFAKIKQSISVLLSFLVIALLIIISGVYKNFMEIIDFLWEAVYLTSDAFLGTSFGNGAGHYTGLLDSFLIWPQSFSEWLFGHGEYMLIGSKYGASDIGFICQLGYGGIIYLVLICFPVIYMAMSYFKHKQWESLVSILIIFIIMDWKGDVFLQTNLMYLVMILFYCNYNFLAYETNLNYYSRI